MKFTDTATAKDPIPKVLAREEWTRKVLEKLRTDDLTSEERVAYQMSLARQASYEEIDRTFELGMKKVEETQQQLEAVEQRLEQVKQRLEEAEQQAEQRLEQAEQKIEETEQQAEQATQTAIKKLLQKGILDNENIAEIFDVDLEYIQQIKEELES